MRKTFKFLAITLFLVAATRVARHVRHRSLLTIAEPSILRDAPGFTRLDGTGSALDQLESTAPQDAIAHTPPDMHAVEINNPEASTKQAASGLRGASRRLVPEILNLPKDASIPRAALDQYSVSVIAESLIERLRHMDSRSPAMPPSAENVDLWDDTELHIFIHSKNLLDIARTGVKNAFQLDRGGDPRNRTEQDIISVKLSNDYKDPIINRLRPKYGAVYFTKFDIPSNANGPAYGDLILILKNELKFRSTWVPGDSLISVEMRDWTGPGGTFWDRLPLSDIKKPNDPLEFEVWGDVEIEDVEAIGVYNLNTRHGTPQPVVDLVAGAGFKVIQFEGNNYKKVGVISPGDTTALSQWIEKVRIGEIK